MAVPDEEPADVELVDDALDRLDRLELDDAEEALDAEYGELDDELSAEDADDP